MSLLDSMPHLCTIQKEVTSAGSLGGSKLAMTDVTTGVGCWVQTASSSEVDMYAKRGMTINYKVFFSSDPNVTEHNRIKVTHIHGAAVSSPRSLKVMSVPHPDASAGLGVLYRVMCEELSGEFA